MNNNYHNNFHRNIPIINANYAYTQPKYVTSLYSSPKKSTGNFSFNYGMRHYYSAEIKSDSKINHSVHKPIYILNPLYVANHLSNKIYNTNSLYVLSNPIQANINKLVINTNQQNFNNNNMINQNNGSQIKTNKTMIYNTNTINYNINPQINVNQNISRKNTNILSIKKDNNSYESHTVKTNIINNNNKERMTYQQYTNPKNFNFEKNIKLLFFIYQLFI